MNNTKKIIILIIVLLIAVGVVWYAYGNSGRVRLKNFDSFAQCLHDKGVTMYGAYYCSHCKDQKSEFGSSFQYVSYVECTQEIAKCQEKKIAGFPTWIFPDGKRIEGKVSLEELSRMSGCGLP